MCASKTTESAHICCKRIESVLKGQKVERSGHLSARKEVGVGLDPCNDFTQNDSIGEDVSLKTEEHSVKQEFTHQGLGSREQNSQLTTADQRSFCV